MAQPRDRPQPYLPMAPGGGRALCPVGIGSDWYCQPMPPTLDTLLDHPAVASLLAVALLIAVVYLREVGPRRAIALDQLRTLVWRLVDPVARRRGRPLTRDKTEATDEYIVSVDAGLLEVARLLWDAGYRWNPLATAKWRERVDGRREWALLSVAYRESAMADDQHHVYIFRGVDGALDVYGHREASVTRPGAHDGGDELVPGDPDERLPVEVLREARQ